MLSLFYFCLLGARASVPGMYDVEKCTCLKENLPDRDPSVPPVRDDCYTPLCPKGYYLCCYHCTMSTCANAEFMNMTMSLRGRKECIPCAPGDFCAGCDKFEECPQNKDMSSVMRFSISQPGSSDTTDCRSCPGGFEPSLLRERCVPIFRDACDQSYLLRCRAECESAENRCREMKCMLKCAKEYSSACLERYRGVCRHYMDPQVFSVDGHDADDTGALAFGSGEAGTTITTTTTSFVPPKCEINCDTDGAFRAALLWPVMFIVLGL